MPVAPEHKTNIWLPVLGFCIAFVLPWFMNDYWIHLAIITLLYAYLGACWNILGGYTGLACFGQSAFYGIGGYTSTVLLIQLNMTPWIGMLLGGILAALIGLFMGYLSFHYKLKGWYFSLVTLAFAEILQIAATNFFPGQSAGLYVPYRENQLLYYQFASKTINYIIILVLLSLIFLVTHWIARRRLGFFLRAIRDDEEVAASLGVNLMKYKLIAMALSAFFTALGGTFYIQYLQFIDPEIAFRMDITIEMVLRPLIGGLGTLWGPLVGSLLLTPLAEICNVFLGGRMGVHLIFYGIILILVIIYAPQGLIPIIREKLWGEGRSGASVVALLGSSNGK